MKVTITTPFARLAVEMDPIKAAALMTEALIQATPEPTVERPVHGAYAGLFHTSPEDESAYAAYADSLRQVEPPESTLTSKKEDPEPDTISTESAVPAAPPATDSSFDEDPDPTGWSAEDPTPVNGYRGFLHVKCAHCHKEKSFHIKWPLKEYRCECGHTTPLRSLSKVFAKCDCGWDLKYYTNQDADSFELKCISCEKPVLVKWDFRHKRYEEA